VLKRFSPFDQRCAGRQMSPLRDGALQQSTLGIGEPCNAPITQEKVHASHGRVPVRLIEVRLLLLIDGLTRADRVYSPLLTESALINVKSMKLRGSLPRVMLGNPIANSNATLTSGSAISAPSVTTSSMLRPNRFALLTQAFKAAF
jgi:hypothetical protein